MKLIVQPNSMRPIYEQICDQVRAAIKSGNLQSGQPMPSIRTVARECQISALTAKKAYDLLEQEGYVRTVQGKGTFVAELNPQLVEEEMKHELESQLETLIAKAKTWNMAKGEFDELVDLLWEE